MKRYAVVIYNHIDHEAYIEFVEATSEDAAKHLVVLQYHEQYEALAAKEVPVA